MIIDNSCILCKILITQNKKFLSEMCNMTKDEFKRRFQHACDKVIAAEPILTEIDSHFGDADHGITMTKICSAVKNSLNEDTPSIKAMLNQAAQSVLTLSGGSAVPLWNTWLDGLQENAPDENEIDISGLKKIFANAFEEFSDMSGAQVGDKTIIDALAPASEIIASYSGNSEAELFTQAAEAAVKGTEATKEFKAKFGRAKSYGAKTLGTPDAGAKSMSCFFEGLAEA